MGADEHGRANGTERLTALAAERDMAYVDAPVLGTKQPAEQAQLVVIASGPPDVRPQVDPIFAVVGRETAGSATRPARPRGSRSCSTTGSSA